MTRLSAATETGRWLVEMIGDHTGRCFNDVNGKSVHRVGTDPKFVMRYRAIVTEVPQS